MEHNKQEEQEAYISRVINQPPATLFDMGVGPKSEYKTLKGLYPDMEMFGCEPLADLYPDLEKDFYGVILPIAIGEDGEVAIHYDNDALLCATGVEKGRKANTRIVDSMTLDTFDMVMCYPERILLWADIEGMELTMLESGPELLSSGRVLWINLEEHLDDVEQNESIKTFLEKYGYLRMLEYNKHPGHQDVVYVHKSEVRSAK